MLARARYLACFSRTTSQVSYRQPSTTSMDSRSSSYTSTPSRIPQEASKSSPTMLPRTILLAQRPGPDHDRRMLRLNLGRVPPLPFLGGLRLPLPSRYPSTRNADVECNSPSLCASCTASIASLDTEDPTCRPGVLLYPRQSIHPWRFSGGDGEALCNNCSQASAVSPPERP